MRYAIKSRYSWVHAPCWEGEIEDEGSEALNLRVAVLSAHGAHANLGGANLRDADLVGADLVGADLVGADLGGANLGDANLRDANLGGADLRDANLGGANLRDANLVGANLRDANLGGADLVGANLRDADMGGADLVGANLRDANLVGADLGGANLRGAGKVKTFRLFAGLYQYDCMAILAEDGTPWVRMGCLWKSVEEWDRIGIRASNRGEFPDDGSERCEERVRAFDFTRAAALRLAEMDKNEEP